MPKRLTKEMKCIECGCEYIATYISGSKPRRTCGVECQVMLEGLAYTLAEMNRVSYEELDPEVWEYDMFIDATEGDPY